MPKPTKTNAMRQLDAARIPYECKTYEVDESDLSGTHIAAQIGIACERTFKTLVTRGDRTGPLVFCLPAHREIDLRLAASITGNKKLEMVPVKELLALTGYIRGGCSPIGMKKKFPTYIHVSALDHPTITVSAGCRGIQLLLDPVQLIEMIGAQTEEFCMPEE
ncbi:MAG: Cys-tRNA(Pro) deacylase [Clostridia bacterium]|nr:Cys-tRNA(Pro) deacylase [Clostridia bacterium]